MVCVLISLKCSELSGNKYTNVESRGRSGEGSRQNMRYVGVEYIRIKEEGAEL